MRVESSITSVTWIPSEAIKGMPKLPFEMGIAHYDEPLPDRIEDLESMHEHDLFREANELRAWIETDDGKITGHGYSGRGRVGVTRLKLLGREIAFPAVQYPLIRPEPEAGPDWVKFTQSAGGHMGLPAPRRVKGKPFFKIASASAWTTLELIIYADGSSKGRLSGASPFPRHWIYDDNGELVEKSGSIESERERELSASIMRSDAKLDRRSLGEGETLTEQGAEGNELYLLLDGVLGVEVDGEPVAEVGPGALLGERALLEGKRTATLRASTPARVVVVPADAIEEAALSELAAGHKRED